MRILEQSTFRLLSPHRALYVNEDGLHLELPHNTEATKVINPNTMVLDFIRGNAILVKA